MVREPATSAAKARERECRTSERRSVVLAFMVFSGVIGVDRYGFSGTGLEDQHDAAEDAEDDADG
jgi:hypothetical protein